MPFAPARPCSISSCPGRAVRNGRCERHAGEHERTRQTTPYGGREWRGISAAWLEAHPHCGDRLDGPSAEHSECRRLGFDVKAHQTDHIRAHRGDRRLFTDPRNFQSLCRRCHGRKTATHDGGWGHGPG